MSISERKIKKKDDKEKLEQLISDASTLGIKFIELRYNKRTIIGPRYQGVLELRIEERSRNRGTEFGFFSEWLEDGQLIFHPDRRDVCWGYLPVRSMSNKKDKNLLFLAETLRRGEFTIVDSDVLEKVREIAKENDWPTSPVPFSKIENYLSKKRKENVELVKNELESENELLKAKLALLEEKERIANIEKAQLEESLEVAKKSPKKRYTRADKPLHGKKTNVKSKEEVKKEEE